MDPFEESMGEYLRRIAAALASADASSVLETVSILRGVRDREGTALICGNGGSAAVATHFAADLVRAGDRRPSEPPADPSGRGMRALSLVEAVPLVTGVANDEGYEQVFSRGLETWARPGDVLVAISCSGDSPNVVRALEAAPRLGVTPVALLGRSGGSARRLAEVSVVVDAQDFGVVESAHTALCHLIADELRRG